MSAPELNNGILYSIVLALVAVLTKFSSRHEIAAESGKGQIFSMPCTLTTNLSDNVPVFYGIASARHREPYADLSDTILIEYQSES